MATQRLAVSEGNNPYVLEDSVFKEANLAAFSVVLRQSLAM